jgi:hypothetical protein
MAGFKVSTEDVLLYEEKVVRLPRPASVSRPEDLLCDPIALPETWAHLYARCGVLTLIVAAGGSRPPSRTTVLLRKRLLSGWSYVYWLAAAAKANDVTTPSSTITTIGPDGPDVRFRAPRRRPLASTRPERARRGAAPLGRSHDQDSAATPES